MSETFTPIRTLDARYYTDPEVFRIEQDGLLARTWQFAGHVSQLQKPGDYFAFDVAGQSLFCVRDREGAIRAFYNVCQHRAHEVVRGEGQAGLIVCPYHAWTYELTGALRSGPNIKAVPGFDRGEICLTSVNVEEFCGFLFVNLDPYARPMDEWFPAARRELSAFIPHHGSEARGMGGNSGKLQLEGLGRKLFRMLPLKAQPSDFCQRRGQAGNL